MSPDKISVIVRISNLKTPRKTTAAIFGSLLPVGEDMQGVDYIRAGLGIADHQHVQISSLIFRKSLGVFVIT